MIEGWQLKAIGEVCDLATGGTPSTANPAFYGGEIQWLVSGDIHLREIWECAGRITEEGMKASNAKFLPINSVMIALNGQGKTRGTVALLRTMATCNQSLVSITPKPTAGLLPEFLFANLHGRYEEIRRLTSDADNDRRGLNMGMIRAIKVPIAPIPEQQRIVTLLDEAFDGITTAKTNAEKNLQNARELFAGYLNSAIAEPGEGCIEQRLGSVCEVKDGTHDSPEYVDDGIPFITQKNIRTDGLSFSNTKFIRQIDHDNYFRRSNPGAGDILISMIGANRGMACIVDDERTFSIKNVGLVKKNGHVNSNFLLYFLKSLRATEYVRSASRGGAQEFIGLTALRNFPINIPSLSVQNEISESLDVLAAETKRLESIYEKKITYLDELKKSLLHRAFTGQI